MVGYRVEVQYGTVVVEKTQTGSSSLCKPKVIMSNLLKGMDLIMDIFFKYAGTDQQKSTLSKTELKELLTKELGEYFGAYIEREREKGEENNDGAVGWLGLWEEKEDGAKGVSYCIYWPVHPSLTHFPLLPFHLC
ncbi:hypothetical protein KOW79_000436 [Hemibagrus wyckioides]|uniref:S100/CaBP-9k-type calcium binding subdomain domain-containing protein n=1 Tax=Hemibagrus wyckioides TaxID=337641 RepID=A0A9D3PAB6_9TELE|nr:hypothetical protein KOW79_000436 [Hemibagrus wyckioides]